MIVLSDNCVDTATTTLDAHTPQVGGSWGKNPIAGATGVASISNANRIRTTTGGVGIYYVNNVPAGADQSLAADYWAATILTGTVINGLALREDPVADTEYIAGYLGSTLSWVIQKFVAGSKTTLASTAATLTAGNTYALLFTVVGTALTLFVAGVSTVSTTDSSITLAGRFGLRMGSPAGTDTTGYQVTNLVGDDGALTVPRLFDRHTQRRYVRW